MEIKNHVYFVNIACKFIIVTMLIVTRMASQYYFCQNRWLFFVCVLFPISGVFTTHSICLRFILSFAIENFCNNLSMSHSV